VKRSQRHSSSPALPTIRALPPQKRRLVDLPGLLPATRVAGGLAVVLLALGTAAGAAIALEQGTLPPIAIPLASLSVLAATAAYLAGRSEGKHEISTTAERGRTKGRLRSGTSRARDRSATGVPDSSAGDATNAGNTAAGAGLASQAGSIALRTKFLDDISQSLRAPITSICLAARIIRKHFDSTPEVVAHFGDTLLAEADRLGQTVDEFLELARLESGLVEWHEAEVDAADLIQRAVAEVEPVAVSYGVSVAFTMEPALPPLHIDRERVAQALTILLAMAVRSASEGSEIIIQIAGAHGGWVFTVGGTSFVYPHAEARKVHGR
jgi:signal transduction histidine kinase